VNEIMLRKSLRIESKILSFLRLAEGAARIALLRKGDHFDLIRVDVFATSLTRRSDDDAAWRAASEAVCPVLFRHDIACDRDIQKLRAQIEARLTAELLAKNQCPGFSHEQSFAMMLKNLGAGDWRIRRPRRWRRRSSSLRRG